MTKARVTQKHHIAYSTPDHPNQEWIVRIYKGEHELIGKMHLYSRKTVSKGFLTCLKVFIAKSENRALELEE